MGARESTSSTTTFPGFVGHFKGKRRDAVATGTVVVDGETLVDGTTTNAEIKTLEDKNTTTGGGQPPPRAVGAGSCGHPVPAASPSRYVASSTATTSPAAIPSGGAALR